ncbi:hypothetical protein GTP27_19720 [Pseudoduganella sp. CY13W]|uniref:Aerotolerance regulator N-terminal domain-containing protein n=1 Tax=Duganella qianjiadongensis TaxID=2692176 RepID=A0ABW9VPP1_9BURK|nr:hypothetical protein [Duganella qianjiadongensis]
MVSSYPYWWLALPLLLLPWWWHRQKRQRLKAEPLATARFLPAAEPQQLRIWQWRDRLLLAARCLLLLALLAWLAATILPWRGDTVLLDQGADPAWAQQQIDAAGMAQAQRLDLPEQPLRWLAAHEREWRATAHVLIVSRAERIAMPAHPPQFAHAVTLKVASAAGAAAPAASLPQEIVLATTPERAALWRALLAAFASAGTAPGQSVQPLRVVETPGPATSLIIWDRPEAAPANWKALHWWQGAQVPAAGGQGAAGVLSFNGISLQYADTARGRVWTSAAFPPRDTEAAHALYESWQQLQAAAAQPYGLASQHWASAVPAPGSAAEAQPARWLAYLLLALFMIERILCHARRN